MKCGPLDNTVYRCCAIALKNHQKPIYVTSLCKKKKKGWYNVVAGM